MVSITKYVRHCDEAIHSSVWPLDCFAALAMKSAGLSAEAVEKLKADFLGLKPAGK
jgi:hypothetical protein